MWRSRFMTTGKQLLKDIISQAEAASKRLASLKSSLVELAKESSNKNDGEKMCKESSDTKSSCGCNCSSNFKGAAWAIERLEQEVEHLILRIERLTEEVESSKDKIHNLEVYLKIQKDIDKNFPKEHIEASLADPK